MEKRCWSEGERAFLIFVTNKFGINWGELAEKYGVIFGNRNQVSLRSQYYRITSLKKKEHYEDLIEKLNIKQKFENKMNSNEQEVDNNPSTSSMNFSALTQSEGDQSVLKEDHELWTPANSSRSKSEKLAWTTNDCINLGVYINFNDFINHIINHFITYHSFSLYC